MRLFSLPFTSLAFDTILITILCILLYAVRAYRSIQTQSPPRTLNRGRRASPRGHFVCSLCVPLDRNTNTSSHSRTGGLTSLPLRMQLVRTSQSKHKINLLALSTEDGGPYVVATWYVVLIVCSSCVPLNSNTNTSSHSPRRTGGPQALASGALVMSTFWIMLKISKSWSSLSSFNP